MALGYSDLLHNLKRVDFVRHWPVFRHHVEPVGLVPDTPAGHAAWYYCMCCVGLFRELDAGSAQYEGEADHTDMQANILMSTAALYHLESPSEIINMLPFVRKQAEAIGIGYDFRFDQVKRDGFRSKDNS